MYRFFLIVLVSLIPPVAWSHSGGLDKCGGHNDRQKGGYHVHNSSQYCACYSDAPQCRTGDEVRVDEAIAAYKQAAQDISIGDEKARVLARLNPVTDLLPPGQGREPEGFMMDGKAIEVVFARSRRVVGAAVSDDDFTPFVFEGGVLVCKGWRCAKQYL